MGGEGGGANVKPIHPKAFVVGDSKVTTDGVRFTRLHTSFLVIWTLSRLALALRDTSDDNAARKRAAIHTWGALASAAETQTIGDAAVDIVFENHQRVELAFLQDHRVHGLKDLVAADPHLEAAWAERRATFPQLFPKSNVVGVSHNVWLVFLWLWRESSAPPAASNWVASHIRDAADHMSLRLNAWVLEQTQRPIDPWNRSTLLMDLRTPSGRRQALDPLYNRDQQIKRQRLNGSATTMAEALLGRGTHLENTNMHTMNRLMLNGTRELLGKQKTLSINFDPGTYSGSSTNIALWYAREIQVAGPFPPKVRVCHLSLGFIRLWLLVVASDLPRSGGVFLCLFLGQPTPMDLGLPLP